MTSEFPEFLATIVAVIGVGISLAALVMTLLNHQERRTNQRMDRLEERMDRGFEQLRSEMNQQSDSLRAEMNQQYEGLRAEMNRRFDEQDVRIRGLEQGQAYMSGQFSELKDYFVHRPPSGNNPETGD